jgi:hypothetical protein
MNIPPSEAKALSLWEYQALLWQWNEAHNYDADGEAPDAERTQELLDRINADPRLTGPPPAKELVN